MQGKVRNLNDLIQASDTIHLPTTAGLLRGRKTPSSSNDATKRKDCTKLCLRNDSVQKRRRPSFSPVLLLLSVPSVCTAAEQRRSMFDALWVPPSVSGEQWRRLRAALFTLSSSLRRSPTTPSHFGFNHPQRDADASLCFHLPLPLSPLHPPNLIKLRIHFARYASWSFSPRPSLSILAGQ